MKKNLYSSGTKYLYLQNDMPDTVIIYRTLNADIIFDKNDSKKLVEKKLKKPHLDSWSYKEYNSFLDTINNLNCSPTFKDPFLEEFNEVDFKYGGIYYNWLARELLLSGKAMVIEKSSGKIISKIKFEVVKDNLGLYSEKFYLPNGSKLIDGKIMLGE